MDCNEKRHRRRHCAVFKAAAVAACGEPGASVAAVALERQVNANLLRRWVKESKAAGLAKVVAVTASQPAPAFVPMKLESRAEPRREERPIRVHIRKGRSRITIEWPATAAGSCAGWLRGRGAAAHRAPSPAGSAREPK